MTRRIYTLLAGLLAAQPCLAFDHAGVARQALERHIRPGYDHFANAAGRFEAATAALCGAPSTARLKKTRAAFRDTVLAWGRVEHIGFGPVTEEKRRDRLVFWPDRKGLGRKQVENLIAASASTPLAAEALSGKSVAVQGLTAFDVVGFGPGSEALAGRSGAGRCRYAAAVAANVAGIARAVKTGWTDPTGFSAVWLNPGPENPHFLDAAETTRALVRAFIDGLEVTRDSRLAGPLGFKDRTLRPLAPPFPNSHLAVPLIAADIEGLSALLKDSGFLDEGVVASPGAPSNETAATLRAIAEELGLAIKAAKKAAALSPTPFTDPKGKEQLVLMGFPLRNARFTGGAALSSAAGLGIGLNASDGD